MMIYAVTMKYSLPSEILVDKFFMGIEIPMKCRGKYCTHEQPMNEWVFMGRYTIKSCEISSMKILWKMYK